MSSVLHKQLTCTDALASALKPHPTELSRLSAVHIYSKPVDLAQIRNQEEELDGVEWFDVDYLERVIASEDENFCVPPDGFAIVKKWCEEKLL